MKTWSQFTKIIKIVYSIIKKKQFFNIIKPPKIPQLKDNKIPFPNPRSSKFKFLSKNLNSWVKPKSKNTSSSRKVTSSNQTMTQKSSKILWRPSKLLAIRLVIITLWLFKIVNNIFSLLKIKINNQLVSKNNTVVKMLALIELIGNRMY